MATQQAQALEPSNQGVIVIGAGLAGWGVIDAIRSKDAQIPITLITSDNGDRYHKPMLTMAISQNKQASDLIRATGAEAAQAANITLLAQTTVTDIDAQTKQVTICHNSNSQNSNGDVLSSDSTKQLGYEHLVLAMGAHPIFPSSLPQDKVWHVNHIERFSQLQAALSQGSQHVAIVGAGMVGTEIAEDLLKAGHQVTLIDLNDAPLAQMLPAQAIQRIRQAIESQGIQFLGNCQVLSVEESAEDNYNYQIQYKQSQTTGTLLVHQVIASTGLLVDIHLPTQAGIEFDRRTGIAVNPATLQTSVADIYAIGDCMSIAGVPCRFVAPLRAQAATIAGQILGDTDASYEHKSPMIRLKNKAISVVVTGEPRASKSWQVSNETEAELILNQVDAQEEVTATVTIKAPNIQA
ncbi:NAD(P)/FAD-dependent oxidoreductase [Psychrobacter sp. I-STPA6b]|uniref:NAD(P)/FAD-dependent oxidoreductase n=1 Tax=Psychrobacter sp. I-STPA6b TaxID=2585718 RepID=UPI001D0C88AA|nr:FAD-dependent oxidoreductase [Psychrobacter sp. I-STPA6b]